MLSGSLSENKMALFNILSTVIIAGVNFFTIPIFTRMLDTDGYGIVNVYSAWVSIFVVFIGLKADGSIGTAKANLPEEDQDSYQFSILALSTVAFLVIFVAVLLLLEPVSTLLSLEPLLVVCMVVQSFGAFVISLLTTIDDTYGVLPAIKALPFTDLGFSWLPFAIVGGIIGAVAFKAIKGNKESKAVA